jgi:hypothetical protein
VFGPKLDSFARQVITLFLQFKGVFFFQPPHFLIIGEDYQIKKLCDIHMGLFLS